MTTEGVTRDLAEVAAELLSAEDRKLAESQAKFQAEFEAREAKFGSDLAALVPLKAKDATNSATAARWVLARKCWAWLYHD